MTTYESIKVKPMTPTIGAVITGIDLTQPLSNQQVEELHTAFAEHLVIFFRDQKVDHESHKRFGRYFGDLYFHSASTGIPDHPEIIRLHADGNSDHVAGDMWHSDLSCDPNPPLGSVLYLHTLPPLGGDTLFASMYAAYDALSDSMKAYVESLAATHDANPIYAYKGENRRYNVSIHPLVKTHPVTKKKLLYFNEQYVSKINGVPERESNAIFRFLSDHCADAMFHTRFTWEPHSIAFWDNRCAQHYAIWDYYPHERSGFRVTIANNLHTA